MCKIESLLIPHKEGCGKKALMAAAPDDATAIRGDARTKILMATFYKMTVKGS